MCFKCIYGCTCFLQRTRGLYFNGEHLCAIEIEVRRHWSDYSPRSTLCDGKPTALQNEKMKNLSVSFDEVNNGATPTAPLVQSSGSLRSVFSFPVIHKVGNVGSFVRHKFEN